MSFTESTCHSIDNNKYGCGVFIDLKQGFWYCKSFWVFLLKLYHYGVRGEVYDWYKSYLSSREQSYLSMHGHLEPMVSLKDLFLDLCYFCYMSMIYQTFQKRWLFFYLLITLICIVHLRIFMILNQSWIMRLKLLENIFRANRPIWFFFF